LRLLLIDDNEEITEAIGFYCKSAKDKDIDCQVINEGKEGLESIRNEEFDLIMLDLAMPEFTGLDVIKSLQQDGIIKSKNIVIFTASSDRTVLDEIKNSGVKEVFKKPCSLDDLVELIEKYRPRAK
jgi:two-component system OmpR family response regulator